LIDPPQETGECRPKAKALVPDMSTHPQQALAHAIRFLSIDAIVKAQEGP
jgi:hypothetical protein